MKNFIIIFIVFVLVMALAGCDTEKIPEDEPNIEPEVSEPEIDENAPVVEGNFYDEFGYTVTLNGETVRYYPTFMQNNSEVVYDENCNPTVLVGGALTEEEVNSREDIFFDIPTETDWAMVMQPNTKAVYDLHGFIQNIYYEVPVGSGNYQLAPPEFDGKDDEQEVLQEAELFFTGTGEYYTVKAGDTVGNWVVSEVYAQPAEAPNSKYEKDIGLCLSGEEVFEGYIRRNDAYDDAYDIIINFSSAYKIPRLVMEEYHLSKDCFRAMFAEGLANKPTFDTDEILYCRVTVNAVDISCSSLGFADRMYITKIEPIEAPTAEFTLDGNAQTIAIGESIGDWTLTNFEAICDEDMGEIIQAEGIFTGNAVLEGTIIRNEMLELAYDLKISQEESNKKVPHYIDSDGGRAYTSFRLDMPEEIENSLNLEKGEEVKCRVTVSEFRFESAPRMVLDWMVVTAIEILK